MQRKGLAAAEAAKDVSRGHCRKCGCKRPLEAHHWTKGPYPPAHLTTADDLTALCCDCHDEAHDFRFFLDAGGLPADDGRQVGRAVWFEGEWGALVTGRARPSAGRVGAAPGPVPQSRPPTRESSPREASWP